MIVAFNPASRTASSGAPLPIVQPANQNASNKNNPTHKPRTRKLGSVFPKPTADHARTTRCIRIGQESFGSLCHNSENDGSSDKCTRSTSSRHSPPALRKKRTCKYAANNVTSAAAIQLE